MRTKMLIRRRMAVSSFISIIVVLFLMLIMCFFGTEQVGENLLKASGIVSPILICLTGIIVQYAHSAHQNDLKDGDNDQAR